MRDNDLIQKIQQLKDIRPNENWAVSARQNLINHIEQSEKVSVPFKLINWGEAPFVAMFSHAKLSGAFVVTVVGLMIVSTLMAQRSLPGQPLYNVKIALEGAQTTVIPGESRKLDLKVSFIDRRVQEASKLASNKLDAGSVAIVTEKLDTYRQDLEDSKTEEDVNIIKEQTRILTVAINEASSSISFEDNLRTQIEVRLDTCENEELNVQIAELLASGDVASLIDANELSIHCQDVE